MKKPLLLGSALMIFSVSTAMSTQLETTDDPQTPHRTVTLPQVEPTPGQRLSQRQAEVLTRERFVAVLDATVVDSWGIKWELFQDQSLLFDAPLKRVALKKMIEKLQKEDLSTIEKMALFGQVSQFKIQMEAVHSQRLDILALAYFSQLFPGANLTPEMKLGGVQLGERIIVHQGLPNELTYHVKTHSAGRLSSNSTAAKLVNPQELMAYRVLQYLGVGCETHFFQRSPEDVYIATLDAGTGGQFTLFEVMSGHLGHGGDEAVGARLAGNLIKIPQNCQQVDNNTVELSIVSDTTAQNFISQLSKLDIVTRICKLHDLLNNPANFGFFETLSQSANLKIIDFRVIDDPVYSRENYDPFGGFLVGNGLYNYAGSHKTMRYVLHDRDRPMRVQTAQILVRSGLTEAIKQSARKAYEDMTAYINLDVFVRDRTELMFKVNEYFESIEYNAEVFARRVQEWTPEADAAREAEYARYRRPGNTR